jgi:O-antigen/teichoic acid export membrane protein
MESECKDIFEMVKFRHKADRLLANRHHYSRLAKALLLSVGNQVISSGSNFALGLYLVRTLSSVEFGLYGIAFAISLFYTGIGNSLFLTQMVVHTPDKLSEDRLPYAGRMFIALCGFNAAFCTCMVIVLGTVAAIFFNEYLYYSLAIVAVSVASLSKDFFIRHAYNHGQENWVLIINSALTVSMISALAILHFYGISITVVLALWLYALAHAIASICGYALSRLPLQGARWILIRADVLESWVGGSWATATNILYLLRTQAYTVVVASVLGPIGVAKLNAARLFITPTVMLTPALSQVFLPRLAQSVHNAPSRVFFKGRLFTAVLLMITISYSLLLFSVFDFIELSVTQGRYGSLFWLVAGWAVFSCVLSIRNGQEIAFQALRWFKYQTIANAPSAIITVIAVTLLTNWYGPGGAISGLILGELVLVIIYSHHMWRKK